MSELPSGVTPESRLRLTGGRYKAPGYPMEALPELMQYERLVVDVAKALWRRDHPGRVRVPRGFDSVVGLRLTKIVDGSATPVLVRPPAGSESLDFDPPSLLDSAQDLIDAAFAQIVASNRLPADFPPDLGGHFLRLGRTLQDDEAIEFGNRANGAVARYTQPIRKRFLLANQSLEFAVDGTVVGQITALDTNDLSLTLTDLAGRKIPAKFADESMTADLKDVFNQVDLAPVVRLECTHLVANDETVTRIEDIRNIEVFLAAEDVPGRARLVELLQLGSGWLDGDGDSPDLLAIEQARDLLFDASEAGLPTPGVFPRLDGSVQVQWITHSDVWTAVVSGEGPIEVDYLGVETDSAGDATVASTAEAVSYFADRMKQVAE